MTLEEGKPAPLAKPPNAHFTILLEVDLGPVRNSVNLAWVFFIRVLPCPFPVT